jgi:Flp pilus assembly protein TadD
MSKPSSPPAFLNVPIDDICFDASFDPTIRNVRPYLDLQSDGGPVHARILRHQALAILRGEATRAPWQGNPPAGFRILILGESRLYTYACSEPAELAPELCGPEWAALCESVDRWPELDNATSALVLTTLNRLSFYRLVIRLAREREKRAVLPGEHAMALANAIFKDGKDRGSAGQALALLGQIYHSVPSSRRRLLAAAAILVHHARITRDSGEVARWSSVLLRSRDEAREGDCHDDVVQSVLLRAASFGPFFAHDMAETERVLDECEALAYVAPADTAELALVKAENIHAMLETRSRAAQRTGDWSRALAYARALAAHDPLDNRVHRDLGFLLLARTELAGAADSFEHAARLGPPFSAVSMYLGGFCHWLAGRKHEALRGFQSAAATDPGSVSAAIAVHRLGTELGDFAAAQWAHEHLAELPPMPPDQAHPEDGR